MNVEEATALAAEVTGALRRAGASEAEVYLKEGRGRRLAIGGAGTEHQVSVEEGWAVRGGDRRASFFVAGTGRPDPAGPWPSPLGLPSPLPDPMPVRRWAEPGDLQSPLASELEAQALLDAIRQALAAELPAARLLDAVLEEGSSESVLASSHGIRAQWRRRVALLRLVATAPGEGDVPVRASLEQGVREARRLQPRLLARMLADRLAVRAQGERPDREGDDLVVSPAVATRLLAGLLPLLVGPEARARATPFLEPGGRLGASALSIVDDGRLAGGLLASAVDGEGVPTRPLPLVEGGIYRQPLLAWWQARGPGVAASGCSLRPSFRDPPRPGPTHLFVRPQEGVRPASLVAAVARGSYLLDSEGAGRFDLDADRFSLPVCGFALEAGAARHRWAGGWLCGTVSGLLHGVRGVARDLAFQPGGGGAGVIGSPTLLLAGLELRGAP